MRPAQTPKIVNGSISMCVVAGVASASYRAICSCPEPMSEIVYIHLHQTLIGGQLPTTVLQKYLQADQAVVLLIHVQIFHKTFS
jgi:hypothetical protein